MDIEDRRVDLQLHRPCHSHRRPGNTALPDARGTLDRPHQFSTSVVCRGVPVVTGICLSLIPFAGAQFRLLKHAPVRFGAAQSFFAPVLAALALSLAGHARLNKLIGNNQGWNHAGNIVAAVVGILVVAKFGLQGVFYTVGITSLMAAASVVLIRRDDLNPYLATGRTDNRKDGIPARALLRQRPVLMLFVAVALFHFSNAPILPSVALYVQKLGGSAKLMTATVLTAQAVMVPVALIAGRMVERWGASR